MRSLAWLVLALAPGVVLAQKKPFDAAAMLRIQRIADPQLSPDGKTVRSRSAFPDLAENKSLHSVWSVPLDGGAPRKLADRADRPRWSPDGKRIFYVSTIRRFVADLEHESGWLRHRGGDAPLHRSRWRNRFTGRQIPRRHQQGLSGMRQPASMTPATSKHLMRRSQSKVKARLITGLLYRHWNEWEGNRRSHLLSISLADGKVVDLLARHDCAKFRHSRSADPTTTRFRPTARKSASP